MPPVRILVTGALGYVGQHLCRALSLHQNIELHGTYRLKRSSSLPASVHLHPLDLTNTQATNALLQELQPHQVYHLAGNIRAGRTRQTDSHAAWQDNLHATLHLYDACATISPLPCIVFVSTGAIYGEANGIITEATPLQPLSPYAASKAAADLASYQYWRTHHLPIVRARLFNYLGPGQDEETALARFAKELVAMERLNQPPAVLTVGNLQAERDFTDIADVVRALCLLMEQGAPGEAYNIATGVSHPMKWYLDRLIELVTMPVEVVMDQTMQRRAEAVHLQVDVSKIKQATGWVPGVTVGESLMSLLQSFRSSPSLTPGERG